MTRRAHLSTPSSAASHCYAALSVLLRPDLRTVGDVRLRVPALLLDTVVDIVLGHVNDQGISLQLVGRNGRLRLREGQAALVCRVAPRVLGHGQTELHLAVWQIALVRSRPGVMR